LPARVPNASGASRAKFQAGTSSVPGEARHGGKASLLVIVDLCFLS
jgi:hypothetical protein